MIYIYKFLLMIYSFIIINIINAKTNDSIFVPTKEWKRVNKGSILLRTPIPIGLHVRYNFQTGITEAKFLDDKENRKNLKEKINKLQKHSLIIHSNESLVNEQIKINTKKQNSLVKINVDELKFVLKEINLDESYNPQLLKNYESNQQKRRQKFKNYSELKQELITLNMNISTGTEVITSLFNKFQMYTKFITSNNLESMKIQNILKILNNLEYLVHQIDNAHIFSDMEGMAKIILPSLNSAVSEVKAEALKLLGAAVQSNPRVQLQAMKHDFVQKLLHMLTGNNKVKVKSRCLFALGALLRHFPVAQKVFLNNSGLEIFGHILSNGHFQIQIRVMNLINDLIVEHQNSDKIENKQKLKKKEYNLLKFEYKLSMQKYCEHLVDLMIRSPKNFESYDFNQIIYESMIILNFICKDKYIKKKEIILKEIIKIMVTYNFTKLNISNKNFYLRDQKLLKKLQSIIVKNQHEEL